uniref:Putative helicase n=1 Tax=viral metagenome TaxID=1070528 RepID=A0A6M3J1J6_9ZZZZ
MLSLPKVMTVITPVRGLPRIVVEGPRASLEWLWKSKDPESPQLEYLQGQGVKRTSFYISFPAEPRLYELLESKGVEPKATAQHWYRDTTRSEVARMRWLAQEDCKSSHPMGSQLLPFQRVGAEFIAKAGNCLLCDETGLGKTAQAIVGVEASTNHSCVLVVCLKTLQLWWQAEYERWSVEHLPVVVLESSTRNQQLPDPNMFEGWLVVNYRQLLLTPQLYSIHWDYVVYDEGHTLCNRKTKTYQAAQKLRTRRSVVVSATPYGNNPAEVWALLHLLAAHKWSSYWRFYEMYVNYKENPFGGREILGVRNDHLLRRDLAPVMIRRRKVDVYPQLPEKRHQTIPLKMEETQAEIYRTAAREMYIQLPGDEVLPITSTVARITRLRQILSSPSVFGVEDASIKIDFVKDFLETYTGKVVLWSLYRATVRDLLELCRALDHPAVVVWGGMTATETEDARQAFITGKARVLVGTIMGAGTGLNLRSAGCEAVIFIEQHWSPTRQQQAEDRVHGIGQTGSVVVYNLHCRGTVDDLVAKVLERKLQMTSVVLERNLREELERWL